VNKKKSSFQNAPKEESEVKDTSVHTLTFLRWALLIALFSVYSTGVSSGQSLVEVAKKEKERRSKNESESSRVITDRDLQTHSRLPESLPGTPVEGEDEAVNEAEAGEEEPEVDETKTREYWQKRVEGVNQKIKKLEEDLNSPDMSWGDGLRQDVNPIGQRNLSRRGELEQQLAQARAELQAIQDEARRAGVPPGWVR
jgi:hypothetical protein